MMRVICFLLLFCAVGVSFAGKIKNQLPPQVIVQFEKSVFSEGDTLVAVAFVTSVDTTEVEIFANGNRLNLEGGKARFKMNVGYVNYLDLSKKVGNVYKELQKNYVSFEFKYPVSSRGDTVVVIEKEYTVTSNSRLKLKHNTFLYIDCLNQLSAYPENNKFFQEAVFNVVNGVCVVHKENNSLDVIPAGKYSQLLMGFENGERESTKFTSVSIPVPCFSVLADQRKVSFDELINGRKCPRGISLKIYPGEMFKYQCPEDANYYIEEFQVVLMDGDLFVGQKTIKGPGKRNGSKTAKIADLASKSKQGMQLIVKVKKVTRKNYKGEKEDVEILSPVVFTIPLN